jgi:hypothetical protein
VAWPSVRTVTSAFALSAILLFLDATRSLAQEPFIGVAEITNAIVALRSEKATQPVAVIRASRVHTDYQRRGFFKIGALPVLVLDDLRLEIREPAALTNALQNFHLRLAKSASARQAVELRHASLFYTADPRRRLRAATVRIGSPNTWLLKDGVFERPGLSPIAFQDGRLTIGGAGAGQLQFKTAGGAFRTHLAVLLNSQNPQPKPL